MNIYLLFVVVFAWSIQKGPYATKEALGAILKREALPDRRFECGDTSIISSHININSDDCTYIDLLSGDAAYPDRREED